MSGHEDAETSCRAFKAIEGCSLQHAQTELRSRLHAVGSIPEDERHGFEWRALEQWCQEAGLILPDNVGPQRVGGREHDLTALPEHDAWLKFTKP